VTSAPNTATRTQLGVSDRRALRQCYRSASGIDGMHRTRAPARVRPARRPSAGAVPGPVGACSAAKLTVRLLALPPLCLAPLGLDPRLFSWAGIIENPSLSPCNCAGTGSGNCENRFFSKEGKKRRNGSEKNGPWCFRGSSFFSVMPQSRGCAEFPTAGHPVYWRRPLAFAQARTPGARAVQVRACLQLWTHRALVGGEWLTGKKVNCPLPH
jgi:hypothetical protein